MLPGGFSMHLRRTTTLLSMLLCVALAVPATPALADHTEPREPLSPTEGPSNNEGIASGDGEWTFIRNFPPNPGTDLKFFRKRRKLFAATGTLGQGDEGHVGQRIIKLLGKSNRLNVKWIADHGSANCQTRNTSVTSLQHDSQV
ncbi:MAG: hypothetical protein M3238_01485, partial [Actinomycetota bacterium]|nr:hypothetical protein [Actinomycetota bacterium]